MNDQDKVRINPLDANKVYTLWRICILSPFIASGLDYDFGKKDKNSNQAKGASFSSSDTIPSTRPLRTTDFVEPNESKFQHSSSTILSELGYHALRVVKSVIGDPPKMKIKLNKHFYSKTTARRI